MVVKKGGSLWLALLAAGAAFLLLWQAGAVFWHEAYPRRYAQTVERYSEEFGVDRSLIYAVIRTESGFRPQVESSVGARGLMQITRETFEWLSARMGDGEEAGYDDLFDPEVNIRYGAFLLSALTEEFGSVENALCAYHAGWGKAKEWLSSPDYSDGESIHTIPYGDTRRYVEKVGETRRVYQKLYEPATF
ncbi:MAG: lytic transglycosylase domain-containing protein [Oscillospiraceae bacterium]|nr:lytic transglycosylase domain-containing protein [Oscillospiraceae bacterium]